MSIAEGSLTLTRGDHGIYTSSRMGAVSYPEEGNREYFRIEDRSLWFRHRSNCIASVMKQHPPGGPVLDVGGGNGLMTRRMLDEGFDAELLEPGPEGALNARTERGIPTVICATLEEAGLQGESVHGAGCFDVLEHIEDDKGFTELIHGLLVPGGMLYGTVPAGRWLWSHSDRSAGHFRRYGRRDLLELLSGRFEILFLIGLFGVFTLPLFLSRVIPYRMGLSSLLGSPTLENEHGVDTGPIVSALYRLLDGELANIRGGGSRRAGTSLLFAARKTGGQR